MYSERFDRALTFASRMHRTQVRKGTNTPYVNHLLAVAAIVGESGGTEDQVIGGLLHDCIEDCISDVPDIRAKIEQEFGAEVLAIVEACTDADVIPKPPWRERKESYIAKLRTKAPGHSALLVSLADKIHNSRSILRDYEQLGEELWSRFRGGRDGTLWYYRELSLALSDKELGALAEELEQIVDALHQLAGDGV